MSNLTALRFAQMEDTDAAATPAAAWAAARVRVDRLVLEAPGRVTWACRSGCAACCHLLVRVSLGEADAITAYVDATFSVDAREALVTRAQAVAERAEESTPGAYRAQRLRCAFLDEQDRCVVYALRPLKCRVHASRSAEACAEIDFDLPLDAWLTMVGEAIHARMGPAPLEELHGAFLRRLS